MAVTNLTGTTWVFDIALKADYTKSFSYNVTWDYVINYNGTTETGTGEVFPLQYSGGNTYFPSDQSGNGGGYTSNLLYYGYYTVPKVMSNFYPNFESFSVTFTGGADVTNTALIAWLEANAVQQGGGDEDDPLYSIKKSTLTSIADSIRSKTGKTDLIKPENMPSEIDGISGGGGGGGTTVKSAAFVGVFAGADIQSNHPNITINTTVEVN